MKVNSSQQDKVVASGMSGRLPESDNLKEFWDHLMNKDDLVTSDNRRWDSGTFDSYLCFSF